jgi:hypothetical protein
MMLFTIYTLFGTDIEILSNTQSHGSDYLSFSVSISYFSFHLLLDQIYENLFTVCFICFSTELLMNTIARTTIHSFCFPYFNWEGYLFSFFWWLDLIAIVSLFPDLNWIAQPLGLKNVMESFHGSSSISQAARVVRLVRLVRLVKLYKIQFSKWKKAKEEKELFELASYGIITMEEAINYQSLHEKRSNSKLGSRLSDSITKKVMVIVLVMIIILPLLTFTAVDHSSHFAMDFLQRFHTDPSTNLPTLNAVISSITEYTDEDTIPDNFLLRLKVQPYSGTLPTAAGGFVYDLHKNHRYPKFLKLNITNSWFDSVSQSTFTTSGLFTQYNYAVTDATYSIIFTIIVGIILVSGAIIFTSDAENLVLKPIERMMNMVEAVAENPLAAISLSPSLGETAENKNENEPKRRGSVASVLPGKVVKGKMEKDQKEGRYETRLLETTLEKITGKIALPFSSSFLISIK